MKYSRYGGAAVAIARLSPIGQRYLFYTSEFASLNICNVNICSPDWHPELQQCDNLSRPAQPDAQRLWQTICRPGYHWVCVCGHHCLRPHLHLLAAPPPQDEKHGEKHSHTHTHNHLT